MDIDATRELLSAVFPESSKFNDRGFLSWEYLTSPSGRVISAEEHDDEGLIGHYAVLPQRWRVQGREQLWALSLNTAVSERGRGRGLFTTLAERTYDLARESGVQAIVGVANANSTPGFAGRLRFNILGPLPTRVLLPLPARGYRHVERVTPHDIQDLLTPRDSSATHRLWDLDELTWRLSDPTQRFDVLRGTNGAAVVCRSTQKGVPVAVMAKFFPDRSTDVMNPGALIAAACRMYKAPIAIHAGHRPDVQLKGLPIPMRLRPSPLNLILRGLDAEAIPTPTHFEFLDFDAY